MVSIRANSIVKFALLGCVFSVIVATAYGRENPVAYSQVIAPFSELKTPRGAGPYPLAILLPGCTSWHPHHSLWRKRLLKKGFAVLHVDSFAVRRIRDRRKMLDQVCTGALMQGGERAGDLMAILPSIWARTDIDEAKTILMGWSHGGWSASDFLSMVASGDRPPNLTANVPLEKKNFKAAFFFYPYCGAVSISAKKGFPEATNSVIFHGLKDRITSARECKVKAGRLSKSGGPVEFVGFDKALHWFDNHTAEKFDRAATRQATEIIEKRLYRAIDSRNSTGRTESKTDDLINLFDDVMN